MNSQYKGTNNFETMQAFNSFQSPSMNLYKLIETFTKIIALFFGYLTDFSYLCIIKQVQLKIQPSCNNLQTQIPALKVIIKFKAQSSARPKGACYQRDARMFKVWAAQNLRPVISPTSSHAQPGSNSNPCWVKIPPLSHSPDSSVARSFLSK